MQVLIIRCISFSYSHGWYAPGAASGPPHPHVIKESSARNKRNARELLGAAGVGAAGVRRFRLPTVSWMAALDVRVSQGMHCIAKAWR